MKIICLSGSTQFKLEFEDLAYHHSITGNFVLMPVVFSHFEGFSLSESEKRNFKTDTF